MFRQIILKLTDHELKYEDYEFINILDNTEMTHWAMPIFTNCKNAFRTKIK